MAKIEIMSSGTQASVQDLGRIAYQKMGMPISGVMDNYAARCANMLVGNAENAALLESALLGVEIRFLDQNLIAVTGADMDAHINGVKIKAWKSYLMNRGDVLKLSYAKNGLRAYIAFSGGIDVPILMGSSATYIKGKVGGFHGRLLKPCDVLDTHDSSQAYMIREISTHHIPSYDNNIIVRAVPGPHSECFSHKGVETFFTQTYKVGSRSDRMGIFLEGSPIEFQNETADILSSAVTMGSVQVTNDATPVVLMAERQTTGGYGQIATVISPDLPKLAQARPGDNIVFQKIDVYEAQRLYQEYEQKIATIKEELTSGLAITSSRTQTLTLGAKAYKTIIEEVV